LVVRWWGRDNTIQYNATIIRIRKIGLRCLQRRRPTFFGESEICEGSVVDESLHHVESLCGDVHGEEMTYTAIR
jgi:hypothetical protein